MKKLLLLFIIFACTKPPVGPVTTGPSIETPAIKVELTERCSNFTPTPVDILFVVDNSGSVPFIKADIVSAVKKIARAAGQFFDYRIYVVPLIPREGETHFVRRQYQLIQNKPSGVPLSASIISPEQISIPSLLNRSAEHGFARVVDIIKSNSKIREPLLDNIFRDKAFTMAIMLSNGDDNDFSSVDSQGNVLDNKFDTHLTNFKNLKNSLEMKQFRFLSVVNHTKCGSTVFNPGQRYKTMSNQIYASQQILDSNNQSIPDSYDLCSADFDKIFDSVATTISNLKNGHTYKFWPLGESDDFDPSKLIVKKRITGEVLIQGNLSSGYTVLPNKETNFDIIDRSVHANLQIVPAERYNGHFIELHGSGRVTYPDCLVVRKEDFDKFFGFVVWGDEFSEPDPATLKLFIDGQEINENLWEYQGHQASVNLLVKSKTDLSAFTPGIFETGFTIKLKEGAVHSDGAKIEVRYKARKIE